MSSQLLLQRFLDFLRPNITSSIQFQDQAWRQALLSKIAGEEELSGEDLERHEKFLKAKEEQPDAAKKKNRRDREIQRIH